MTSWRSRAALTVLGAAGLVLLAPGAASAHPLGNFTVNRYSGLVVSTDAVTIEHVLDLAEIPTAQRVPAIDTSGDRVLSGAELVVWAESTCTTAADALQLTVGGERTALEVDDASARRLRGQAGLPVLRATCDLRAGIPQLARPTAITLVDTAATGEVGWKEMTAQGDGTTLTKSDVPRRTISKALASYPQDLLSSPSDVATVRLQVRPGGTNLQPDRAAGDDLSRDSGFVRGADRLTQAFTDLVDDYDGGPAVVTLALLAAIALGAAHAVAPGHGKTIMAFYLSGRRDGALRSAATVGATVTATHTLSVLVLGSLVSVGTSFATAEVYPWLRVASGLLVVAVGVVLLRAARRGAPGHTHGTGPGQHTHGPSGVTVAQPARSELVSTVAADTGAHAGLGSTVARPEPAPDHPHDHEHPHDHDHPHHDHPHDQDDPHGHDHPDDHDHGPEHTHEVPQPTVGGLVAIGLAGGLLPSPSALLVFLGALAVGQAWFGVALVVAFGVGMAATLAVVGLVVMGLRERAERRLATRPSGRFAPVLRVVPLLTAAVVIVLGAILTLGGVGATGIV